MFNFSGNLLAGQHDTKKKRTPPSKPIPVTFPSFEQPNPSVSGPLPSWTINKEAGVAAHFLNLKKPSDVSRDTLTLLNVKFQPECDFETLLSSLSSNPQSHLPSKEWLKPPEHIDLLMSSGSAVTLLSNGRRKPDHNEFFVRARELLFNNDDAFSTLTRKSSRGQAPLRLAHFRKFWEGLDNMAYYWDNSLDEYCLPSPGPSKSGNKVLSDPTTVKTDFPGGESPGTTGTDWNAKTESELGNPSEEEPRKKPRVEAVNSPTVDVSSQSNCIPGGTTAASQPPLGNSSRVLPARTAPPKVPWATILEPSNKPVDLSQGSYRGYRIGNGAEMPDQYRIDCVRAFVEPIAWAFGVTLSQHRRPPVLRLENVRFPVRMSSVAWRGPQDRARARQGWMEGPVLGIQCRADVNFGSMATLEAESVLDTVRELGGLLLIAQERAREGKTERRGGEGKWWTTQDRWGGGPGGEVGEATRRRPTPVEIWKTLKPSHPSWDPKVVYEAIGKDRSLEWDDVLMVSSLNHHISVLRLRVHPLYLDYLTEGVLPEGSPSDPNWCCPQLQRTRWFNLFEVDDRTEAMRGIWGIMSHMMRREERPEDTKMA
ncbi:hypothetical protein GQ44DRAFT_703000 [Phaeosphaeriaceae sp. PMI808]|nr:hypothetical protein GQ44DRAFT_703000 [Phaeosphaeriaceae sp. PMI808]